jgi:TP901 family phage tail tape measure protein
MAFKVGEAEVVVGGNVIPLKRDMLKGEKIVKNSSRKMRTSMDKVQRKAGMMGKTMLAAFGGVALGAGIVLAGKAIIGVGANFERSMATVRGVTRATDKQFAALTAQAKLLGETTEWTAGQAAGALKFLGMAGFSAEKAIAALPGVLDLATAGGIELARSADIASNALTAMQLDVSELGRVNDVFVSTITRSNTNMEMLAESFKYGAPKARAYGYSIEELSGLIGTLGNAGIQGSMAGTQLSFAFGKVDKAAKKLGLGSGAKLLDVLRAMNKQGYSAAQVMGIFGERGGRAALVLRGLIPMVEQLTAANMASMGEAKKLADVMRNTVVGAWAELKSAIEGIAIDAFTGQQSKLAGTLRSLTQTVRDNKGAWVALATSLLKVTGMMVALAAAAGRAWRSVAGSGTELYQRFEKLKDVGFMRVEDWQRQAAEGTKVLEEWIAGAEQRLRDFKVDPNWSQKLLPQPAELTDLWATTKVTPYFEISKSDIEKLRHTILELPHIISPSDFTEPIEIPVRLQNIFDARRLAKETLGTTPGGLVNTEVVSQHEKARQMQAAADRQYADELKIINTELTKAEDDRVNKMRELAQINDMMATSMTNNFLEMIDGTKKAGQAFKDMAVGIVRELAQMIIKQAIFNALQSVTKSWFGASEGGVLDTSGPKKGYAVGGVFNSPTMFAHGGGLGVMGEAGPEAILPLTRTSKGLGVVAAMPQNDNGGNGGQVNLIIENMNINAVDALSFQELTERNPDAILQPIKIALTEGDIGLASLLKE